ncbi:MAG TPA: inositol 2-dehydrogenase [Woeseiaceae bacterium]|nr:inositol 2-dehydrogenase [Woeseiaceae bacterium]
MSAIHINLCLFGAGRIGQIHGANIAAHPEASLKYVVDVDPSAATKLGSRLGARVADVKTALADGDIHGVVIATSTDTHLPLIEAAAAAGKGIFCEKPLDLDETTARACISLAANAGVSLYVGFNRRYDPSFRRLKDEISAGKIGAVEVVSIISRDPSPPPADYIRRSGGMFRDMTIHDLDMASWLLGEQPQSVFASGSSLIDRSIADAGDIDTAVVVLETASGALCQITNSRRCSYGYDQRIEVFGAEGMLRADNETATRVEHAGSRGFLREPALPFFLERYRQAYQLEIEDFIGALQGRANSLARGADGLSALILADAAERSRQSGQAIRIGQ